MEIQIQDSDPVILKRKKQIHKILPEKTKEEKKEPFQIKNKDSKDILNTNKDTFYNMCNGYNPRIFYKIKEYINKDTYNIYIFIGNTNESIKKIIIKKELNSSLTDSEKEIFKSFLGRGNKDILDLKNKSGGSIKYINDIIHIDDSIQLLKKKIFINLSNNEKYILPEHQHLWIKMKSNKIKTETLGYNYKNNNGNITHTNPFKFLNIDYSFVTNTGEKINNRLIENKFKILDDYETIYLNEIFLINISSIIDFINSGDHFNGNKDHIYYGFILKYWPFINNSNAFKDLKINQNKIKEKFSELQMTLNEREKISNIIYENYPKALSELKYNSCGLLLCVIHINFPGGEDIFDINKIFNNLELSYDIPFLKYKPDNSYETKYKIFKGISEHGSDDKPYITEKRLNSWRKNVVVKTVNGKDEYKITGIPKGLSIKQFLYEDIDEKKFSTINLFKDGKIEIKLYWTENKEANLRNIKFALGKSKKLIQNINKMNISLKNNPFLKMKLPDPNFLLKTPGETNTNIIFINSIIQLELNNSLKISDLIYISKCLYPYISIVEETDNLKKNILHFRYKRVSNYENLSLIDTFINRKYKELILIEERERANLIIKSIHQNFNLSKDHANKSYIDWKNKAKGEEDNQGIQKYIKLKQDPGTDIKIQKSLTKNVYKVMIEGVKNISQLKKINNFLRSMFYIYNQNDKKILTNLSCNISKQEELEKEDEGDDGNEVKTIGDHEIDEKTQYMDDDDNNDDGYSGYSSSDSNRGYSTSGNDSNGSDDTESDSNSENSNHGKEVENKIELSKLVNIPIREYTLKRLGSADSKLFKYDPKSTGKLAYSRICGEVELRQPIVITKSDKEKIDKLHPGSYNEYLEYGSTKNNQNIYICPKYWCIRCNTSLTEEEIYDTETVFNSKIKDITNDAIEIEEDIGKQKNASKIIDTGGIIKSNIYFYINDTELPKIKILGPNKTEYNWGEKINQKPKKDLGIKKGGILFFKKKKEVPECPSCKGKFIPKGDGGKPADATIIVRDSKYFSFGNKKAYPGFLDKNQHPDHLCMPCCFKTWDTSNQKQKRNECLKLDNKLEDNSKNKNERYIKSVEKFPLDKNKYGVFHEILNNLFGNNIEEMFNKGQSGLLNEGVSCFLRKGIKQSHNSFINAVSLIHNDEWVNRDELEFIDKKIINNLNPEIFSILNNGNLVLIFRSNYNLNDSNIDSFIHWCNKYSNFIEKNQISELLTIKSMGDINKLNSNQIQILYRIHNIYTAINNFKNYLESNSIKNEEYLWDMFSRDNFIFTNGINIVLFTINQDTNVDDIYITCPYGLDPELIFDRNKDTCFIIKIGKYYEPIYKILVKNGILERKKRFTFSKEIGNRNELEILKNIEKIFLENCQLKENNEYQIFKEKENINFELYNANETYKRINEIKVFSDRFKVINQVVDYYNKVQALILKHGFIENDKKPTFIPVKPSNIIKDKSIQIITGIETFKFKNLIDTITSLEGIHNYLITSDSRRINCKPIKLVINKTNFIIGIQLINGGVVPISPSENFENNEYTDLLELLDSKTENKTQLETFITQNGKFKNLFNWNSQLKQINNLNKKETYLKLKKIIEMKQININLILNYDSSMNVSKDIYDDRVKFMNKMYFEDQSYQKLKYEINTFLQLNNKISGILKDSIYSIINDDIETIENKRNRLKEPINELIQKISSISNKKQNIEDTYNSKNIKNERCNKNSNKNKCHENQNCIWDKSKCKLYLNENNLIDGKLNQNKYSSLIIEELLRNKIKRREILEGLIDDIQDNDNNNKNNEFIFTDNELNNGKLKDIYDINFNKYIKNKDLYYYENNDENENENPLPIILQKKLKFDYKININNKTPESLLECFVRIANNLDITTFKKILDDKYKKIFHKFNFKIIRKIFLEFILKAPKKGDISYWEYLKNSYYELYKLKKINEIETEDNFNEYIKSNLHWFTNKDLEVFHDIFQLNIIILSRKNKINPSGIDIIYKKKYNSYIILFITQLEGTNKFKYENVTLNNKIIFYIENFSFEFQGIILSYIEDKPIIKIKKKRKNIVEIVPFVKPIILIKKKQIEK
jgi:hypothetical protein